MAKQEGLKNVLVSNGFMSQQALQQLESVVDAINVDLKAFHEDFYKQYCQARLKPVLENLKTIKEMGWWLEVTTLIIPGLNDSRQELQELCRFIVSELGQDVPWHISRFHPAHKMQDRAGTPLETLEEAYGIGKQSGLNYVYLGNVPLHKSESTYCPSCGEVVIQRSGFSLRSKNLNQGKCASCQADIAGRGLD
jgi:pyruvate formate lyase activating enzyme